jgi:hypothetical protein
MANKRQKACAGIKGWETNLIKGNRKSLILDVDFTLQVSNDPQSRPGGFSRGRYKPGRWFKTLRNRPTTEGKYPELQIEKG